MGTGSGLAALLRALEDRAHVLAAHVLERDEVAVADLTELEDLRDVRVRELHRDLRLVDEHRDELLVLGDRREDALDGDHALEALHAEGLRLEDLGHAADVDALEEQYFPKGMGFFTCLARLSRVTERDQRAFQRKTRAALCGESVEKLLGTGQQAFTYPTHFGRSASIDPPRGRGLGQKDAGATCIPRRSLP
jgi:hypothetical protein